MKKKRAKVVEGLFGTETFHYKQGCGTTNILKAPGPYTY
jgi:hypothetical protein